MTDNTPTIAVGDRYVFRPTDSALQPRAGQTVQVVAVIDQADATHDQEAQPMYRVHFPDGARFDTWADELHLPDDALTVRQAAWARDNVNAADTVDRAAARRILSDAPTDVAQKGGEQ